MPWPSSTIATAAWCWRSIRRILGDAGDAEEVLQEVFLQVWAQADRYDSRRAAPATWVTLLARSRAIDLLRSRQVRQRTAEAAGSEPHARHASPEGVRAVWYEERQQRVRAALGELPEEQRTVLELAFFEGLTQREIAERTEHSAGHGEDADAVGDEEAAHGAARRARELL